MSLQFVGSYTSDTGTITASPTIPAGRCVALAYGEDQATPFTVVINGATLTNDAWDGTNTLAGSFSGTIPSGSSLSVTGGSNFHDAMIGVWVWTGLGTFATHNDGFENVPLAVTAGDYLFALSLTAVGDSLDFAGSTVAPTDVGPGTYSVTGSDKIVLFADWSIASSSASFGVNSSQFNAIFAADYTPSGGGGATDDGVATRGGAMQAITLMRERASGLLEPVREILRPKRPRLVPGFSF